MPVHFLRNTTEPKNFCNPGLHSVCEVLLEVQGLDYYGFSGRSLRMSEVSLRRVFDVIVV